MTCFFLMLIDSEEEKIEFQKLYNKNKSAFFVYARHYFDDTDLIESIVNYTFFKIAKNYKKIYSKSVEAAEAYIFTILRNECLNQANKNLTYDKHIILVRELEIPVFPNTDVELEEKEILEKLIKAIYIMPSKFRDVLKLSYISGLSLKKIADTLNISESTASYRLKTGNEMLKEVMRKAGFLNDK